MNRSPIAMLAIVALILIAVVALAIFGFAAHILFSPGAASRVSRLILVLGLGIGGVV